MNSPITQFIHTSRLQDNPPQAETLEAAQQALGSLLERNMHYLGYWRRPPAHLGIPWASTWSASRAFEELLADCFVFTLLTPWNILLDLSSTPSRINSLVSHRVGRFLTETERLFDPLGHGLHKRFRATAREMVRQGILQVVDGDPRIDLHTTLAFTPATGTAIPSRGEFRAALADWPGELMPNLIGARRARRHKLSQRLQTLLLELPAKGITTLRLVDLVDTARDAVEQSWRSTGLISPAPRGAALPPLEIPTSFAARQRFRTFLECVSDSIDHLTVDEVTHGHLSSLWMALLAQAQGVPHGAFTEHHPAAPADQVSAARSTLRRLVGFCRGDVDRESSGDLSPEDSPPPRSSLQEQLLQATRRAHAAAPLHNNPRLPTSPTDLCPGQFFSTRSGEQPVLWLVVASDGVDGALHAVPADLHPLVGSHDLPLEVEGFETLQLRCAFEVKIPPHLEDLAHALARLPTTTLRADELERVCRHRRRLASGMRHRTATAEDAEGDPALEDWIEEVLAPACHGLETLFSPLRHQSTRSKRWGTHQPAAARRSILPLPSNPASAGLLTLALLLILVLGIFRHCGPHASAALPQHTAPLAARQCVTLLRTPQWCGEREEIVHARADLHPYLIDLP